MKKIVVLFLALAMLFSLAACAQTGDNTPSNDPTTAPQSGDNNPTEGTDPTKATDPTEGTNPTGEHTHSYTSTVTKEAACMTEGIMTYTCSCSDSYTEAIEVKGHFYSDWEIIVPALIDRDGEQKKTCTVCSHSKTSKNSDNAMSNSFYDAGMPYLLGMNYGALLEYASFTFPEYTDKPVAISTIFAALSERFTITEDDKNSMKEYGEHRFGYDATTGNITLHDYGISGMGSAELVGYVHNSGNEYSTYYAYCPFADVIVHYEVKLVYNRSNNKPNKYLSFEMVDSLPNNMLTE